MLEPYNLKIFGTNNWDLDDIDNLYDFKTNTINNSKAQIILTSRLMHTSFYFKNYCSNIEKLSLKKLTLTLQFKIWASIFFS